ncbi:MAG TPA: HepT-like ribonuclease domain-containing protein [Methylocystis sp.]|nr:HepT-like ribonuclease domain-containing protein [Methylocystis sp.]
MNERDVFLVLDQLVKASQLAMSFIEGLSESDFMEDLRTQQAVAMNLLIIGEAAARLARDHADFLERHPELLWRSMMGMRNRIAHGYFDLDLRVIWRTAQSDLPDLLTRLNEIYKQAGETPL